jgi:hypothetical protein
VIQAVYLTRHARERFRERFNAAATDELIVDQVRHSAPAPAWVRRAAPTKPHQTYLVHGEAVFLVQFLAPEAVRVVSVWSAHAARAVSTKRKTGHEKGSGRHGRRRLRARAAALVDTETGRGEW